MRLVYTATQQEVKLGDRVVLRDGEEVIVDFFRLPHKPSSEGRVSVKAEGSRGSREYYASVIGAEWIEREDRAPVHECDHCGRVYDEPIPAFGCFSDDCPGREQR